MTKLIKYLKPFTLAILLAIGLLYIQAMSDLALPDYMSNIVNTGIQNNGYENAVMGLIHEDAFSELTGQLDEDERAMLAKAYKGSDNKTYTLVKLSKEEIRALEDITFKMLQLDASESYAVNKSIAIAMIKQMESAMGVDAQAKQMSYILKIGLMMLGIALIGAIMSIAVGFIAAKVAAGLGRNLRSALVKKVLSFSGQDFDQFTTASLITRSTNDVAQIQNLMVMMVRMLFYAPLMGIGGAIRAYEKNPSMSWIIALAVFLLMLLIVISFTIAMPKFKAVQKLVDRLNLVTRENLSGMMVIRAFNTQAFEEKRFDHVNQELTATNLFINRLMSLLMPLMNVIMNGVTLTIVWVGAHQIQASNMQVGDMMAFMQYAMQIIFSFLMLSMMFIMIPRAAVSAQRISEILDMKVSVVDSDQTAPYTDGDLCFENVSYRYPGAESDVLKHISFTAKKGQVTAIIGATGSGKSTLVNLIPRFYDTTEGQITIGKRNVKALQQHDLREHIGYVPQKSVLFSGSIATNMTFGKASTTDEKVREAIAIAQGNDIIAEKEEGIQANVAQGGKNLSGGQKQRLSIARAIVKEPHIYIFDDSFSALDYRTDVTLRAELKKYTTDAIVLIVAQRIATIMKADQIIVLDEGKIVGTGTHRELLSTCNAYQEIAASQLSAEELK